MLVICIQGEGVQLWLIIEPVKQISLEKAYYNFVSIC